MNSIWKRGESGREDELRQDPAVEVRRSAQAHTPGLRKVIVTSLFLFSIPNYFRSF